MEFCNETAWTTIGGGGFWTGSGNDIYNTNTGNVGIGTATPSADLELVSDMTTGNGMYIDASTVTSGKGLQIEIDGTAMTSSGRALDITRDGSSRFSVDEWGTIRGGVFRVTSGVASYISNGTLGIKTSNPSVELDVIGDIEYTGTITDVSDERLKENIVTVYNALDKIRALNGVYFNMIDTPEKTEIGVIAQDVQKVLPEAVSVVEPEQGYLGVSYTSIIPVLIEAVKDQQKEIKALEQRIKLLEKLQGK
jgi:hypothetical protein